ncbi:sodium-dependent transporter [Craterilacuibacter sp.]|uniref:sodium-dependent transporter n=1 Tax=Craterilacuibacter sp. TaxID=2870909 RepID=UPI003F374A88
MPQHRHSWGSRLGFILAAAGSAIGLGAIWKFPYVAAQNGGGAFILLYLAFSFSLGLALMVAEIALGRTTRSGASVAYARIGGSRWRLAGLLGVFAGFVLFSFYSVVGGWTFAYLGFALDGRVMATAPAELPALFDNFVSDPLAPLLTHALFALATLAIVLGGIEKGIERAGKVLMPALFVIMLLLVARALTLPGAAAGVIAFLRPDFSELTAARAVDALGLAFFSLSLGVGAMIAYGSYMKTDIAIVPTAAWVVTLAVLVSLLSGLMIFPALAAFGLDPAAGPGLTFIAMPVVFQHLPLGGVFAVAFFALLAMAALSSSVAMLELVAIFFIDDLGWSRHTALCTVTAAVIVCGIPAALSFGVLSDVSIAGKTIFDAMDYFVSNLAMPVGGIALALLAGSAAGQRLADEAGLPARVRRGWQFACRYLIPLLVLSVLLKNL